MYLLFASVPVALCHDPHIHIKDLIYRHNSISRSILSSPDISGFPLFLTCQSPVMPAGAMNRFASLSVVRFSASYNGRGRLPTRDMSPSNTLKSCGNSSRLVFRRNRPTRVIRGSFSILKNRARFGVMDNDSGGIFCPAQFSIRKHGPEFIKIKNAISHSGPFGNIKNISPGFNTYGQCDQQKNREQEKQVP